MPEIPEKLKWFSPFDISLSFGEMVWHVCVDEMTSCIEIKRTPLIKAHVVILALVLAVAVFTVFFAAIFEPNRPSITEDGKVMLVVFMIILPPSILFGLPAFDAFMTVQNSKYWNGSLRFRYDPQNGELFFPRENSTYWQRDCQQVVLGCIRGYDCRVGGGRWNKKRSVSNRPTTQFFILLLDKVGVWKRHDLTLDLGYWPSRESGSKQFIKVVECLRPYLKFEVFVKDYSLDECYEQQHNSDQDHRRTGCGG